MVLKALSFEAHINEGSQKTFRAANIFMRKGMGHTVVSATQASSVTLQILQHGAKENYCNFASFNRVVDKKTSIIQMRPIY